MVQLAPFQRHMLYFSDGGPTPSLTILSGIRASLRLGLNLPVSLLASFSIRLLYGTFPYLRSMPVTSIPHSSFRSQLESAKLTQAAYTKDELLKVLEDSDTETDGIKRQLNKSHIMGLWGLAADVKTGLVDVEDVKRFQKGEWADEVVKRRRSRLPGKGEVLPITRGGPIIVSAESLAMRWMFGVDVYLGR